MISIQVPSEPFSRTNSHRFSFTKVPPRKSPVRQFIDNPAARITRIRPSTLKCITEGCGKEAGKSLQLCWKHDYPKRYWTNPKFREKRKATKRVYGRRRMQEVRDKIAEAIGGWKCIGCGITDRDVLSFDHKRGGGEKERNQMGGQFPMIRYYYMHLDEARNRLQVLCANCNWRQNFLGRYGIRAGRTAVRTRRMRRELIDLLGGPRCGSCGDTDFAILTIDHINGGGTSDRRLRGGYEPMIHHYLTHPGEAIGVLRVLCRNCNWKSHRDRAGLRHLG